MFTVPFERRCEPENHDAGMQQWEPADVVLASPIKFVPAVGSHRANLERLREVPFDSNPAVGITWDHERVVQARVALTVQP